MGGISREERRRRAEQQQQRDVEQALLRASTPDLFAELARRGHDIGAWRTAAQVPEACRTLRRLAVERPEKAAVCEATAAELEASVVALCRLPAADTDGGGR